MRATETADNSENLLKCGNWTLFTDLTFSTPAFRCLWINKWETETWILGMLKDDLKCWGSSVFSKFPNHCRSVFTLSKNCPWLVSGSGSVLNQYWFLFDYLFFFQISIGSFYYQWPLSPLSPFYCLSLLSPSHNVALTYGDGFTLTLHSSC